MSNAVLQDMQKMGIAILQDCKTNRKSMPNSKKISDKVAAPEVLDIHQAAVRKFIKDKPKKKHLIEFFETIIEAEEKKL